MPSSFRSCAVLAALCLAAPCLVAPCLVATSAAAQTDTAMPANKIELDALAASHQYDAVLKRLGAVHEDDLIRLDLNWERARLVDGDSIAIGMAYATDLWRLGLIPASDNTAMKQNAITFALYDLEVAFVDGPSCKDQSAVSHRADGLIFGLAPIWRYGQTLSGPYKTKVTDDALAFESVTASKRKPDTFLCGGGLDEMQHGLGALGDQPLTPSASARGYVGKTYVVPPTPGFTPEFLPDAQWKPEQSKQRAAASVSLRSILDIPQAASTSAPN